MQLVLVPLSLLLLAVALFALQNAQAVTVRFLAWQLESSVALLTLAATAAGAVIGGLVSLAARLRRWRRSRAAAGPRPAPAPGPEPGTPAGPPTRSVP